ncbi:MAG TPA: sodium:proton antiporter, partial [Conexibacter sp.]|nr:sodium:proton antiporter [Conexibacter sp.]
MRLAADRTGMPAAVLFVLAGTLLSVLPGPTDHLDPDVVLELLIPPLLFAAALNASLLQIRSHLRMIGSLSVGLVLATALAVGGTLDLLVPGLGFAAALALGAAVAPPDPVAALAIGRRARMPERLNTLIEGEGLLNDATALTLYGIAVAAAVGGGFAAPEGLGRFVWAVAGGLAAGLAVAFVVRLARTRLDDPLMLNALSLATPFAAYALAEAGDASGVLATVVAGLWLGHQSSRTETGETRLQTRSTWRLIEFLLEGYVFLLIGQQAPEVVEGLGEYPASTVVAAACGTVGAVLLVRPLWLLWLRRLTLVGVVDADDDGFDRDASAGGSASDDAPASGSDGRRARGVRGEPLSLREVLALSWAGTRGVITLATAFALPLDFPDRHLLLFCAYLVVLVTLVGQGLTFAPLLRALKLRSDETEERRVRAEARLASIEAGIRRLDELLGDSRAEQYCYDIVSGGKDKHFFHITQTFFELFFVGKMDISID